MQYQLIATDIDGTLLNTAGQVTPRVRLVLRELARRGVHLVLSTARPPRTTTPLYRDLGLTGPVLAYNGALLYVPGQDGAPDEHLVHRPIPTAAALAVVAVLRALDPTLNVGVELADDAHVDRLLPDAMERCRQQGIPFPGQGDLETVIATTGRGVSKLWLTAPYATRQTIGARLAAAGLAEAVSVTSSGRNFVEILAAGVNKGSGLRLLAEHLGIPLAATMALGDEENDVPALQTAGLGIAMANGSARAKKAARAVTGPNRADGWAAAVQRYVLGA